MKEFILRDIFKEEICVGGKENGRFLRNEVEISLARGPIVLNFEGLPLITQSFSDEFLGPIFAHRGRGILREISFKNCSKDIQIILSSTANRFLTSSQAVA